jgi:hypothetical protein
LPADVAGFTKFTFYVGSTGTVTTPSISFYYTNDPLTASGLASFGGTGIWNLMASSSDQSGTGAVSNPITVIGSYFQVFAPMLAYRIVSNAFTGGGSVIIDVLALP